MILGFCFEYLNFPKHIFNWQKDLYGWKQVLRSWYEKSFTFLILEDFKRSKFYPIFLFKINKNDIFIIQVYADDIIFGSVNKNFKNEFTIFIESEFEMNLVTSLSLVGKDC